jgi:hypothetical protein
MTIYDPNRDNYSWTQNLIGLHGKPGDVWVGQGWRKIVQDTDKLLAYIAPNYQIAQIKEKFGVLRFYFHIPNDDMTEEKLNLVFEIADNIISCAEARSAQTCEDCGVDSRAANISLAPRRGVYGWVVTLCDECRNAE